MLQQARSYRLFVGIDVSSRTFTFASMPSGTTPSRAHTLEQTSVGERIITHVLPARDRLFTHTQSSIPIGMSEPLRCLLEPWCRMTNSTRRL